MLYEIYDGTVRMGGETILDHIHFEIHGTEKIAVVGRNGAGKTTLLRLINNELTLERDDKRRGPGILRSRAVTVGLLSQNAVWDLDLTVEQAVVKYYKEYVQAWDRYGDAHLELYSRERFLFEKEFDRLFTGFGFAKADKKKRIVEFSGGQQTKLAFIRLFLEKPDILLLDEPTNHLDVETVEWLEAYLRSYEKAVVMVSHDRFFLDQTADIVYELSQKKLTRYVGNYTSYRKQKLKNIALQMKAYERQEAELARQKQLIERFKHKPKKAAFARSRKKMVERMELIAKPDADEAHVFTGEIVPESLGSKWVFECEHLKIGYDVPLLELDFRIRRGQKIGVIGPNGAGKTTFLKTVCGQLKALSGKYSLGKDITVGYFDQHSAYISSEKTVAEHFHDRFPSMTEGEVRKILGAFLFGGRQAQKRVCDLSGGERSRLVLCELLESRPNFLVLDEPTNHMDIPAKETLESAFAAYKGTILFISHDRYFIRQVANEILIFEDGGAQYYPFGYEHYMERKRAGEDGLLAQTDAKTAALVAGIRSVPRAERHRLKPLETEEAYVDWQLRLAAEAMEQCRETVCAAYERWQAAANGPGSLDEWWQRLHEAQQDYEMMNERWQEACVQWYDIYQEAAAYDPGDPDKTE